MLWMTLYAALSIVVAIAVFLLAEWVRTPGAPASDCPGRCAIVAGFFWPVLVLGIAQWGLIVAVQAWLCGSARVSGAGGQRPLQAAH